jgi:CHAT domain-containing protein
MCKFFVKAISILKVLPFALMAGFKAGANYQVLRRFLGKILVEITNNEDYFSSVYSLLEENLDKLNDDFIEVLRDFSTDILTKNKPDISHYIAVDIGKFCQLIQDFHLGNPAINIEISITGNTVLLNTIFTPDRFIEEWAGAKNNLGNAYKNRIRANKADNLEEAIDCFNSVLEKIHSSEFSEMWARTKNNLGISYFDRIRGEKAQNIEEAILLWKEASEVFTRNLYPEYWAMTQLNLGNGYAARLKGDPADNQEKAINYYRFALEQYSSEESPEDWALSQINLGNVYTNRIQGDPIKNLNEAILCFSNALKIYKLEKYPEDWANAQSNMGITYVTLGRLYYEREMEENPSESLKKAIDSHQKALQGYTYEKFPEFWAMTQFNLASAYHQLGLIYRDRMQENPSESLEQAINCCQESLKKYTYDLFPQDWAMVQKALGLFYRDRILGSPTENIDKSIQCSKAALKIYTQDQFAKEYAETQFNLGLTYLDGGQFFNAYDCFRESINTLESLRTEVITGDAVKQKIAEEWYRIYPNMLEACLELAKNEPQYHSQALEYVERSKARNLVELLVNKNIYPKLELYHNTEFYETHCHQLEQLRRQIPAIQRELEILIRESEEKNRDQIEQRRQQLTQLQQQRDELLAEINQIDSSFTFTQKVQSIPFSDIQSLTDENTTIVEWYVTGSQILTFIITRHHPHPIVVASENMTALESWDNEYRDSYQSQNTQWINNLASRLQNLAEILHIDEILSCIDQHFSERGAKCNRLILVPHRYLHLFPLHALPLADGKLLFERFPKGVGYAPSCQLLKQAKDQEQNRPDFTRLFTIQNPTRRPSRPLLSSQLEIDKIRQHFDLEQTIILKETEATAANLYECMEQMRSSHCIHFSCHGKFYPESPLKSALLLADPEGKLGEEANLTLGEVFEKLYLNQCRLVTFSACESGMTDPNSISDEYIGLPSGFLYAGSLSIVSTLWTVDPIATTLLMVKFYHNLKRLPQIKEGDVAIALNKAQKWLKTLTYKKWARIQSYPQFQNLIEEAFKNSPKRDRNKFKDSLSESLHLNRQPLPFANPYYWSAFVAIGI